MRFQPKSEEELAASGGGGFEPFPAGEYDFEVLNASEEISKNSGAEMVKLTVAVYNQTGQKRQIFDYLVSSERAMFKIKQFADASGMSDAYERGEMHPEDMVGRTGKLKLKIERSQEYGDQNKIAMYLRPKVADTRPGMTFGMPATSSNRQKAPAGDLEDEIPF